MATTNLKLTTAMWTRRKGFALLILSSCALLSCTAFSRMGSYPSPLQGTASVTRRMANDQRPHQRGSSTILQVWGRDGDIEGYNRIRACVPYILPIIDGDVFGQYIYQRIPILGEISDVLLGPLIHLRDHVPFFSIIFFVALTLGTRFNLEMDRNVRFSAQQAALLDAALIVPEIIRESFMEDPVPRYLAEPCSNFVWYAYVSAVVYCIYSNLRGKRPDGLPYISPFAEIMVGPY